MVILQVFNIKTLKRGREGVVCPAVEASNASASVLKWTLGVFVLHWLVCVLVGITVYILWIDFVGVDGSFPDIMVPLRETKYLLEPGLIFG